MNIAPKSKLVNEFIDSKLKETDLGFFYKILLKNIYAKVLLFVFNSLKGTCIQTSVKTLYFKQFLKIKTCVVNELMLMIT